MPSKNPKARTNEPAPRLSPLEAIKERLQQTSSLHRVQVLLTKQQLDWLRDIAEKNKSSLNRAIRAVIDIAMEEYEAPARKGRTNRLAAAPVDENPEIDPDDIREDGGD